MKLTALIILIAWPLFQFGVGVAKELYKDQSTSDKSSGVVAGILSTGLTYTLYYFAGVFELFKSSL